MTPRLVGQQPDVFEILEDGTRNVEFNGEVDMRIVHSQRARKLRRRGEFLQRLGRTRTGRARYAWFVKGGAPLSLEVPA